jgi:dihydroorotase
MQVVYVLSGATAYVKGKCKRADILVRDGLIADISGHIRPAAGASVFHLNSCFVFPGLVDVHVHLREPGFFYKETIRTGTRAAAHGGFTAVCAMPNLDPVPDSAAHLAAQREIIDRTAAVHVYPYGAVTVGERGEMLSDMEALAPDVVAFSDDGRGIQQDEMMRRAMLRARALGKPIAAHCEVNELLRGGYIHAGRYAAAHGHAGICSESEWKQIERDLALAEETGCAYHVCHISTKESVQLIRAAKARGVDVTCETAPHYLVLCEDDLQEDGRFKMNPPLRSAEDRAALVEGIRDGTIDMVATDHAPHAAEEKARGLRGSAMGVVGLETAFPVLYTELVRPGVIPLERLLELMHDAPGRRFGIGAELAVGQPADLTVFDLDRQYRVDPETFLSRGRATPFAGRAVFGACRMTMVGGEIIWQES